jgi:hypothetical protein
VDTASREQARDLFNAIYGASESVPVDWTGDLTSCSAGATAQSFKDAVQLRINYFRAMAGVPAAITLSPEFSDKDQHAALMMSANGQLSHSPSGAWICYADAGAEAARNSNLALGLNGREAITGYVRDDGSNNAPVGHRRWILYPQTQTMGTGDVPSSGVSYAANALWVFDGHTWEPRPSTREEFVAWPPPGFVPYQVVFARWSFSSPGAGFSAATVTMTQDGANVPVQRESLQSGYGENTLVWIPHDFADSYPRPSADTTYTVTVGHVALGGNLRSFTYNVTVFDPQVPGADSVSPLVSGPVAPPTGEASHYDIVPIPGADAYQWRHARTDPSTEVYAAEGGLAGISATVSSGYNPISTDVRASGKASYHMAQPDVRDQILLVDRTFLPGSAGRLSFMSRLGWATADQTAVVEVSLDDGATWRQLYRQAGTGTAGEMGFVRRSVDLAPLAGSTLTLRFAYRIESGQGSYYPQTGTGIGWYVDDISTNDTSDVTEVTSSPVIASPSFDFTPAAEGSYILQGRALLDGRYPLEWGPAFRVSAKAPAMR